MEAAPRFWQNPDFLSRIYVRSPAGSPVPLSAFAQFGPATAPLAVNHQGLSPAVTISFNLVTGVALGDAVDAINGTTATMGLPGRSTPPSPAPRRLISNRSATNRF